MEAKMMAAALAVKDAMICSNIMTEFRSEAEFDGVLLYSDKTASLHVIDIRTFNACTRHAVLRFLHIHEMVKEDKVKKIYYIYPQSRHSLLSEKTTRTRSVTGTPSTKPGALDPEQQRKPWTRILDESHVVMRANKMV